MDMVAREDVSNTVALNTIALSVTRVIDPALGGALLAFYSPELTLLLSSLWYVTGGRFAERERMGRTVSPPATTGSPIRDLADGFRIVLGDSRMRTVLFISLAANICAWPVLQAFMPVFARDMLKVGVGGLGVLMTASGVGAILGALFIASRGDFAWKGVAYIWGTAGFGLFFALFAIFLWYPLSIVLMVCVGFASATFGVLQATLLLLLAPAEVRGRAMGVQVLAIGVLPLATLVLGAVADALGVAATTVIFGLLLFFAMAVVYITSPGLRAFRGETATTGGHVSFRVTHETLFCYHLLLCAPNSGAGMNRFSIRG